MKILIIEDDRNLQSVLSRLMRRTYNQCDVRITDNADSAIQYLKSEEDFDFIVSDFNLVGEQTGGDILKWVRSYMPHMTSRFLFLTDDFRARELHYNVLEKPAQAEDIKTAISLMVKHD